jgi:glycosyltransferase involved in cell wall biosynthesis
MIKSRYKLSIVIPCFNEMLSLRKLVENCLEYINNDIEIILVDNGSTDNTFKSLLNFSLPSNIIPVRVEKNIGYGNGILFGLKEAKGEVLSWTHADLQTDVSDVIKGFKRYENELISKKCMVKGERKNRNLLDFFFTFSMGIYSSILLNKWMYDINAQPKIFHRSFLKEFENPPLDFSLDLYLMYFFKLRNKRVKTFPVIFKNREYGEAKGGGTFKGKIKLIIRTFKYIHKLKKNLN